MELEPDVSVIVVAHNVRDEVLKCLASVHEHPDDLSFEMFVVDNASTDGTAQAVRDAFPATEVIELPRNEAGIARNHALRRARGRTRLFLDSDATLTEGALGRIVETLGAGNDVGLVGPRLVYPSGELQLSCRRFPPLVLPLLRRPPLSRWLDDSAIVRRHLMADDPHDATRDVEYVISACALFSREAQARAGQLDSRYFHAPEDVDWCMAIRRAGLRVVYEPRAVVIHDYRRSTAASPFTRGALRHLLDFYRFQWKWRRERRRLIAQGRAMDQAALRPGNPRAPY